MLLRDPRNLQALWGRAAMASYFVVVATISTVLHEQSWHQIATGEASALDWFYAAAAASGVISGISFALGWVTIIISYAWISYCVINALVAYPFWAVAPAAVADSASGFLSHVAVAASLMLYLTHAESGRDRF